ncbi:MAG: DivIVA domain-containing protein [Lachnospiraceae bacterium]|nr:DivIVA domain-containing protein [Lachnospiraceae bacterium]
MLTPIEIHNTEHKKGRGYSKKEMDDFLAVITNDYESLYKENVELKNSLNKLNGEMDYYKSMENTLQKALVLAEKTSKDTIETANSKAAVIEKEANIKADKIIDQANNQLNIIRQKCIQLIQQYNQFKMQYKQIAVKQIDLLDSDFYEIYATDLLKNIDAVSDEFESDNSNLPNDSVSDDVIVSNEPEEIKQTESELEIENNDMNQQITKEISPVKMDTLDLLLRDIREEMGEDKSLFEFLDNE